MADTAKSLKIMGQATVYNVPAASSGYEYVIKVNQEEILLFNSTIEEAQAGNGIAYSPNQLEISVEKRVNNNFTTVQINPKNLKISYLEASGVNNQSLELIQTYFEDYNYEPIYLESGDNFETEKEKLFYKNSPGIYSKVENDDDYNETITYYQKIEEAKLPYEIKNNILTYKYIEALKYPQDGFIKIEYLEQDILPDTYEKMPENFEYIPNMYYILDNGAYILATDEEIKENVDYYKKVDKNTTSVSKIITIRPGLNQDMAKLSLAANGIYASIQSSKLEFTSNGLKVHNGGLNITRDEYKEMSEDFTYEPNKYYKLIDSSYVLDTESKKTEGITYYERVFENQLNFNDGNLQITGIINAKDGDFTGTIHAKDGEFEGSITATDGKIDGYLTIGETNDNHLILSNTEEIYNIISINNKDDFEKAEYYYLNTDGEYIKAESYNKDTVYYTKYKKGIQSSNYLIDNAKGFYMDLEGNIIANKLELGTSASIKGQLQVGDNCFIYNPNSNNIPDDDRGKFISIKKVVDDNITNQDLFSLDNKGIITLRKPASSDDKEGIKLDPNEASIKSLNYISGMSGWSIDPQTAEFNNLAARGTFYASVFAYGEISTIGGSVLVRPAAKIRTATQDEGSEYITIELETPTAGFEPKAYCSIKTKQILYQIVKEEIQTLAEDSEVENNKVEPTVEKFKIKKIPQINETDYLEPAEMVGETIIAFGTEDQTSYIKVEENPTEKNFVSGKYYKYNKNDNKYELLSEYDEKLKDYYLPKIDLTENISIALNASDSSASYAPNAISIFSTEHDYNSSTPEYPLFNISPKIVLGKMNGEDSYGGLTGYGLYADNVYLKGSLIAKESFDGNTYYSGINTKSKITWDQGSDAYNFFTSDEYKEMPIDFIYEPGKYYKLTDGSYVLDENDTKTEGITYYEKIQGREVGPILLWAGANNENAIQNSPFLLDAFGNFYAGSGYFKGAILTESTIEAARIKTAIIEGTGKEKNKEEPGLKFINVKNAMSFVGIDEKTSKETEYLKLNTSGLNLSSIPAIFSFNSNNDTSTNTLTEITEKGISTNKEILVHGEETKDGLVSYASIQQNIISLGIGSFQESDDNSNKTNKLEQNSSKQVNIDYGNETGFRIFVNKNVSDGKEDFNIGVDDTYLKSKRTRIEQNLLLNENMEYRKVETSKGNYYDLYILEEKE